jgi:hypothetical protein
MYWMIHNRDPSQKGLQPQVRSLIHLTVETHARGPLLQALFTI